MSSSVIGKLDGQVEKIFFKNGLSRSVEEQKKVEAMSEEEKKEYMAKKKEKDEDIVLY